MSYFNRIYKIIFRLVYRNELGKYAIIYHKKMKFSNFF
jgi:hypothetical protein